MDRQKNQIEANPTHLLLFPPRVSWHLGGCRVSPLLVRVRSEAHDPRYATAAHLLTCRTTKPGARSAGVARADQPQRPAREGRHEEAPPETAVGVPSVGSPGKRTGQAASTPG
jgi:hypothetical protein